MKGASAATTGPAAPAPSTSYGQILRSSALIGGSSLLNVFAGLVRSKACAVLLGPAGFGLMGLFTSILDLAQSIAAMGINGSGVRQIAAAVGSGDRARIARTAAVLRGCTLALGLLGAGGLLLLAAPVASITFGAPGYATAVALLSLAVFFRVLADGRGALLQGLRRIGDMARISVLTGVLGTAATITLVYLLREDGVVPSLVAITAIAFALSWWHARRVELPSVADEPGARHASSVAWLREARALLQLGFAFMVSGMLMLGAAWVVRLLVVRQLGLAEAGFYQAAWTVGSLYVGFVLNAMAADFYPRLTGAIGDPGASNQLVNEQAFISLLLAGPGVLATLVAAPLVLTLFYTAAFAEAAELLRWICLGAALRVITWPMGYLIVARARQGLFLAVELAYVSVYLGLAWLLVDRFGLAGTGIAFLGSYVFHGLLVYPVVRRLTGFRWSGENLRLIALFLACSGAVVCAFWLLPPPAAALFGAAAVAGSGLFSLRTLVRLVAPERLPGTVRKVTEWMRR